MRCAFGEKFGVRQTASRCLVHIRFMNFRHATLLLVLCAQTFFHRLAFSQEAFEQAPGMGNVFGQVTEAETGGELTEVKVTLIGSNLRTESGSDGKYVFLNLAPGTYSISFRKGGYASKALTQVQVVAGEATRRDVELYLEMYELPLLEVYGDPLSGLDAELRLERQESSVLMESVSQEFIDNASLGNAAQIITKATGISVVEGKTAVVRGLSDRYNLTLLNGGSVPTADPYRKSAQLDMFTSDVLEAVTISKTYVPSMPGGFAGALIDLRTKSFPEQFFFKAKIGANYNSQSTGNEDFLTYPGGGLDALAMDDGTRALPEELQGVDGEYLDLLRRTATSGSQAIPTEDKTAAAEELDALTRSFGTPFMGPESKAPPPDHGFELLLGDTVDVFKKPFGYFAGLTYERNYRFYDDGVRGRYSPVASLQPPEPTSLYADTRSVVTAQWSAYANLAYELNENHQVGFNFLYSQTAEDQARRLVGKINTSGDNQFPPGVNRWTHLNTLHFTERNLTSFQLNGGHGLPNVGGLQVDWLATMAETYQDEPDLRFFNMVAEYETDPPNLFIGQNYIPYPDQPVRYFRNLQDEVLGGRLDLTLPVEDGRGLEWSVKAGGAISRSERKFEERTFSYIGGNQTLADPLTFPYNYMVGTNAPPPELDEFRPGRFRYTFDRALSSAFGNNAYDGKQNIDAVYLMAEAPIVESLRLVGGARYETTYLEVNSTRFQSNDISTGLIDQGDFLPAVNLTWSFREDMRLRASYSQTVARPTYREFAAYRAFDPAGDQIVEGNPFLGMSSIQNLDLRWEWYSPIGGLVSLGGFYKFIEDPIEKVNGFIGGDGQLIYGGGGTLVTFENGPDATVLGLEFETRQNLAVLSELLEPFSLGFNFALIDSELENPQEIQDLKLTNTGRSEPTRPLFDQSPFIVNADLTYDNVNSGTTVVVVYYFAAERLALITNSYDVYEQGAPSLDVVISQQITPRLKVKFAAKNILNPEIINSYAVNGSTDTEYVFSKFTRGVNLGLSLSYEF